MSSCWALRIGLSTFIVTLTACEAPAPDLANQTTPAAAVTESDTLRLETAAPAEVRAGDPVPITLRVHNVSGRTLTLHLAGRDLVFDISVRDANGREVWQRLRDQAIPAILRLQQMQPDSSLEMSDQWDQRTNADEVVPAGEYTIEGSLPTDGVPIVTPRVRVRVR
jgi:hypothetical protein